jgi:ketosteroid isomerase-like protein
LIGLAWHTASNSAGNTFKGGTDADYAAMKAQLESVIEAYNAADTAAFKSAYTEVTPGMSQYLFATELEFLDFEVHGDIAYMIGRSTLTGEPREGATVPAFVEERIYTAIFKRQDDAWLIHRHMESTSPREGEPSTIPTK